MKYQFKIHKEGNGYWAQCIEFEGCITQADSIEELHRNMQEALNLYLESHVPNAETKSALDASERGEDIITFESKEDFFKSFD